MTDVFWWHNSQLTKPVAVLDTTNTDECDVVDALVFSFHTLNSNRNVTITIQIGNTDDKLPQRMWSIFIGEVTDMINTLSKEIHFSGGSDPTKPWQNYCWVLLIPEDSVPYLRDQVYKLARKYNQQSIAFTIGSTEFI